MSVMAYFFDAEDRCVSVMAMPRFEPGVEMRRVTSLPTPDAFSSNSTATTFKSDHYVAEGPPVDGVVFYRRVLA